MELYISDEGMTGQVTNSLRIRISSPKIKAIDLLKTRLRKDLDRYFRSQPGQYSGLVSPSPKKGNSINSSPDGPTPVDLEKQQDIAVRAFQRNGFFILVNENQIEDLNQVIELTPHTKLRFIKLLPLVGG